MFRNKRDSYEKLSDEILKRYPQNIKETVKKILGSENAVDTYKTLKDSNVPGYIISNVISDSIEDIANGKVVTADGFVKVVAEDLARQGEYTKTLVSLYHRGLIDEKTYKHDINLIEKVRKEHLESLKKGPERLEERVKKYRVAAIFIWLSFSASFWYFLSGLFKASVTGAVIGGGNVDLNIMYGVIFLLLGLALSHFYLNRE